MTVRQYKTELERQRAHAKREEARINGNPNGTLEEKCLWLRRKNAKLRRKNAKPEHSPNGPPPENP